VPGWLSLRARGDGTFFSITRDSLGVTVGPGGMTSTGATTEQDQQIELHGRAFVEADVLSFFEFVPALWAGFDYVSISGSTSATTATSTVPVFGVGVRRDTL
jgi:hypothetical protein